MIKTDIAEYIAVPLSTIYPDHEMGTSFYIRHGSQQEYRLYRSADYPFEQKDIDALAADGVRVLYVTAYDFHLYQEYLREALPEIIKNEKVSVQQRFESLNLVVRDVLGDVFKSRDIQHIISKSSELGRQTVELVCRDDVVGPELIKVLCHDFQTFTHSANVSYYCALLAKHLGITERNDLNAIVMGALLHDVGKLEVPDRILTKPGRLSAEEFEIMRRHPTDGFLKLQDQEDVSFAQLMMVYQHHEWQDGRGYPVGITEEEIHPWAKICTVADVFEALTSDRPYRSSMPVSKAMEIMDRESDVHFDEEILRCWKTIITSN